MSNVGQAENFVTVEHASKTYVTRSAVLEAVQDATFNVGRTEFVSLLGPSGCGKSTILMALAGLEPITAGSLSIGGQPVRGPRADVGVIFQDPTLLPWKSVLENVLYPVRIQHRDVAQYRVRAIKLLQDVGLGEFLNSVPRQLSGGMRQRVAICRALIYEPDLLLMDEPFSALDAITRDEINVLLLNLWQKVGKSAVFVTHSIQEAVLLSDRVLIMSRRPSRIIADVTIPFSRPRNIDLIGTPEFTAIASELRRLIQSSTTRSALAA